MIIPPYFSLSAFSPTLSPSPYSDPSLFVPLLLAKPSNPENWRMNHRSHCRCSLILRVVLRILTEKPIWNERKEKVLEEEREKFDEMVD
jgi:hypothetical protein